MTFYTQDWIHKQTLWKGLSSPCEPVNPENTITHCIFIGG